MATSDQTTAARPLRLLAMDGEDLAIISAHLQDAIVRMADMAFLPSARRFALVADRFDWCAAGQGRMERCLAGLHFDRVEKIAHAGLPQDKPMTALNLLSIVFEQENAPGGVVLMTFSGGGLLRLHVECIEAQMRDMGPRWMTKLKPGHAIDDLAEQRGCR